MELVFLPSPQVGKDEIQGQGRNTSSPKNACVGGYWKSGQSSERMTRSTCSRLRKGWLRMPLITNETVNTIRNQIVQTYHVCAEGNLSVDRSSRWIWNFWNPFMPSRAANPCNGTLLVPVTNWRNLARSAWSNDLRALQNHWIYHIYKKNNYKIVTKI